MIGIIFNSNTSKKGLFSVSSRKTLLQLVRTFRFATFGVLLILHNGPFEGLETMKYSYNVSACHCLSLRWFKHSGGVGSLSPP